MMGHLTELEGDLEEDDIELLARVFRSQTFKALLKVEKSVESVRNEGPWPKMNSAFIEAKQVYLLLRRKRKQSSLIEALVDFLENPHIQALLATHDLVSNEKLIPRRANIDEDCRKHIKIVTVHKQPGESLGATIKRDQFTDRIVIARILHGGAAQRTGKLQQGDDILEINGIETSDLSLDGVVSLLGLNPETVDFKVLSAEESSDAKEDKEEIFMRAHFSYNPLEDPHIPCKDAGLAFSKGDILEIIDNNETKWWQARRYGIKSAKSGLIPSQQLQEKRLGLKLWSPNNSFNEALESSATSLSPRDRNLVNTSRSDSPTPKGTKKKPKKVKYRATQGDKFHTEEIMLYEEVIQIMADFDRPRPVLITGVRALGCEDLKQKLIQTDPEKFQSPIQYTCRSRKSHEQADKDYHFISRHEMEKAIRSNSFINTEMVKNHFFATSINSIIEVADSGKTCVLFVNAESLPVLCSTDLYPFVVFIKSPQAESLQTLLKMKQDNSLFETHIVADEEIYKILIDSEEIESNYGHYFDLVLTNNDTETTLNQIYHAVRKMQTEPLWVPVRPS